MHHHGIGLLPEYGQGTHDTYHGFILDHDLGDSAGQIVFQQGFSLRIEKWDGDSRIQHADGHPQIDGFTNGNHLPGHSIHGCRVGCIGIRFWIKLGNFQVPIGVLSILIEKILNMTNVVLQLRRHQTVIPRRIKTDFDVGIQVSQNALGSFGKGVEPLRCQIHAWQGNKTGNDIHDHQQDEHDGNPCKGVGYETRLFVVHDF